MISLALRAREKIVRPRRPAGVVVRALNFTVRRLIPMLLASALTLAAAVALITVLVRYRLPPRGNLFVYMVVAVLAPLLTLWIYMAAAYRHWNWSPFEYGSGVPHALAGLASMGLILLGLTHASASTTAKVLMGVIASGLWIVVWFVGSIFTACSMGDCF